VDKVEFETAFEFAARLFPCTTEPSASIFILMRTTRADLLLRWGHQDSSTDTKPVETASAIEPTAPRQH